MIKSRRTFLKASFAASTLAIAAGANLLTPRTVLAAWPKEAFEAKKLDAAMNVVLGGNNLTPSKDINIDAPDIAENGAVVSVKIKSSIPNTESISVFVPVNAFPLSASYNLGSSMDAEITGRIKMAKTSDVIVVVKSNGKLYEARRKVKVTLGGCGG